MIYGRKHNNSIWDWPTFSIRMVQHPNVRSTPYLILVNVIAKLEYYLVHNLIGLFDADSKPKSCMILIDKWKQISAQIKYEIVNLRE